MVLRHLFIHFETFKEDCNFRKNSMNSCNCVGLCQQCRDMHPKIALLKAELALEHAMKATAGENVVRREKDVAVLKQLVKDLKSMEDTGLCQAHNLAKKE